MQPVPASKREERGPASVTPFQPQSLDELGQSLRVWSCSTFRSCSLLSFLHTHKLSTLCYGARKVSCVFAIVWLWRKLIKWEHSVTDREVLWMSGAAIPRTADCPIYLCKIHSCRCSCGGWSINISYYFTFHARERWDIDFQRSYDSSLSWFRLEMLNRWCWIFFLL